VLTQFKLPDKTFRTSFAISALLGFDSYEQYIVDLVQRDIELVKDGSSDLHVKATKDKKVRYLCVHCSNFDELVDYIRF
jgi:hypothetical protein